MQLTPNFNLKEFTESSTAAQLGIDNTPSQVAIMNLTWLAEYVLQPIRDVFGRVQISSGYRSIELNQAVGGAENSAHLDGYAADFVCLDAEMQQVFEWLVDSKIIFHELIDCIQSNGTLHVAYKHNSEIIRLKNAQGKYVTHPWAKRDASDDGRS